MRITFRAVLGVVRRAGAVFLRVLGQLVLWWPFKGMFQPLESRLYSA